MLNDGRGSRLILFAALCLAVSLFAAACIEIAAANSATVDEFAHVPAGVSHWETGDFSLYHENPPLVRCLVSLPVWLSDPLLNYRRALVAEGVRSEWLFAVDFVVLNLANYQELLLSARGIVLALSLLCGGIIFLWAARAFGLSSACICTFLWLTDPNIIAHSSIATLDVGAAAMGCLAVYAFWRFLRDPSWPYTILAGTGLGLATASKFSLLALYPACLIALAFAKMQPPDSEAPATLPSGKLWGRAAIVIGLSVLTLDACYLYKSIGRRLDSFGFESRLLGGAEARSAGTPGVSGGNRFAGTAVGRIPVIVPEDYLSGFDSQKRDEEARLANISSGRLVYGGSWYSPLRTLAYKLPPGTILILAWSLLHWVWAGHRVTLLGIVLMAPPLILLGLLCSQTGLNWAYRYTLPALPFLFIASGAMVRSIWRSRVSRVALALCLIWNVEEAARTRPYYLSYGNPFVGGMAGARRTFLGSNYDWGQDLGRLRDWFARNPRKSHDAFVLFYGPIDGRLWGIGSREGFPDYETKDRLSAASRGKGPLYFIISSNYLNGLPGSYLTLDDSRRTGRLILDEQAGHFDLIERVGSTVFVFEVASYEGQIYVTHENTPSFLGTP